LLRETFFSMVKRLCNEPQWKLIFHHSVSKINSGKNKQAVKLCIPTQNRKGHAVE
jgi:hypothetical protein